MFLPFLIGLQFAFILGLALWLLVLTSTVAAIPRKTPKEALNKLGGEKGIADRMRKGLEGTESMGEMFSSIFRDLMAEGEGEVKGDAKKVERSGTPEKSSEEAEYERMLSMCDETEEYEQMLRVCEE